MGYERRIAWIYDTSSAVSSGKALASSNEDIASTGKSAQAALKQLGTDARSSAAGLDAYAQSTLGALNAEARLLANKQQELAALKQGAEALAALNTLREDEAALARAATTAESAQGQVLLALREEVRSVSEEFDALVASQRREAEAAAADQAALERLEATLVSLAAQEVRTTETIGAERSGAAAVAALNLEYERRNQLIAAGVGLTDSEGRFVITNEEGAAAVLKQVSALEAEEAVLARLKVTQSTQTVAAGITRETNTTASTTAATQQGPEAVAALNRELAIENQLLAAGVAEIDSEGKVVVLYEEEAALIRSKVAALQGEQAALAEVRSQEDAAGASARKMGEDGAAGAGIFGAAVGELLQALKYIVAYGAIFAAAGLFKDAVAGALEYEASLTRLQTLVGVSATEVNSYRDAIHGISAETAQSANDNAQALFAITSSGLRGQQALDALKASAEGAAIGLGDQTTVARAAVSAMIAYGAGTLSAKSALDVIIATAREGNVDVSTLAGGFGRVAGIASTVGVSFAQVGAAVATMTRTGLSADEAFTAVRGTLQALSLRDTKGAETALKSVGLSVQALRDMIQSQGLAQALLTLVSRFDGNSDALAKVIPNIRALAGVLDVAKSQAGDYAQIQDRVNASIGHATDAAFELEKHDPSFVWKQAKTAMEEVGRVLGESVLPTIVDVAQEVTKAASDGSFQVWAQAASAAFAGLVDVGRVAAFALQNLPLILAAYAAYSLAAASAETTLAATTTSLGAGMFAYAASATTAEAATFALASGTGTLSAGMFSYAASAGEAILTTEGLAAAEAELALAGDGLLASLEGITAAIEANPFGAAAAAVLVLLGVVNHWITTSKDADQAFLNEVAASNQGAVAIEKLSHQYDVLAVSKRAAAATGSASGVGLITGPSKSVAGASSNSAIVLRDSGADNFLGQLNSINAAYAIDTERAGDNKTALDAAKLARDRSISSLEAETQALIDNAKAANENEKAKTPQLTSQVEGLKKKLASAQDASASLAASNDPGYQAAYGPEVQENLKAATQDYDNASKSLAIHNQQVVTNDKALASLQKSLDYARASQQQHTATVQTASKAEQNFHDTLQRQIADRFAQAAGVQLEADAELGGAEAVRQATIAAQQQKAITDALLKAKHDKTTLTTAEIQGIRDSIRAESDANLERQRGAALYTATLALIDQEVTNRAQLTDALNGNSFASTKASAEEKAYQSIRTLGLTIDDKEYSDLLQLADAEAARTNATSASRAAIEFNQKATDDLRQAQAQLADAQQKSTNITGLLTLELQAETEAKKEGYVQGTLLYQIYISLLTAKLKETDATKQQAAAQQKLNDLQKTLDQTKADFTDWQSQTAFAAKYGTELEGIYQQYGLLSKASEELAIEQQVLATNAGISDDAQKAANEKSIRNIYAQIDAEKQAWASADIAKWISQPWVDAEASIQSGFWDDFNAELVTGTDNWKAFAQDSEKAILQAIEQGQIRFVEAEEVKQAEALKTLAIQEASAAAGDSTLNSGGGVGGGLSSVGAQPGTILGGGEASGASSGLGSLFGGSAFGGGTAGAFAGAGAWAAVFAAIYFGGNAWLNHVTGAFASATLAFQDDGNLAVNEIKGDSDRLNGVLSGLDQVGADAKSFFASYDAVITGLTDSVSVSKKGRNTSNDFWVTYANGLVKDFGRDAQAAFDFALVQAIKQSDTTGLDALTKAAINDSVATNKDDLTTDADFGHTLATQNFDDVESQGQAAIDTFHAQFQQEVTLYKNDSAALFEAISSSVTKLTSSLWDEYYSLTGKQEDPTAEKQRLADEFNAEKALAIAQIEIAKAQILALEATIQAQGAYAESTTGLGHTLLANAKAFDLATKPLAGGIDDTLTRLQQAETLLDNAENSLPPDLKPGDIHLNSSGGGAGNSHQQAVDTFQQHLDQLQQALMGPSVKAVDDYRNQLIALRKEEDAAKASTAERTEAETLLREQLAKTLNDVIKPWLSAASGGTYGETDFVQQLDAARQSIVDERAALAEERNLTIPGTPPPAPKPPPPRTPPPGTKASGSPPPKRPRAPKPPAPPPVPVPGALGGPTRAQLAEADRNITASFTAQADAAIASFQGLTGSLADIQKQADDLRGNVLALGLSSDDTAKRLAAIDVGQALQVEQGQLGVLDKLYGYLKGSAANAAEVEAFERQKVELDFQILQAQMVAYGIWTDSNAALFVQAEQAALQQAHDDAYSVNTQQTAANTQVDAANTQQQTAAQFASATAALVAYSKSFLSDSTTSYLSVRGQVDASRQTVDQAAAAALAGDTTARGEFQQDATDYLTKFADVFGKGGAFVAESKRIYDELQQVIGIQGPSEGSTASTGGVNYAASGGGVLPVSATAAPPPIAINPSDDPARQAQIKAALDDLKVDDTVAAGAAILKGLGFTDAVIQQAEQWAKGGGPASPTAPTPITPTDLSGNFDRLLKSQSDTTKDLTDTLKSTSGDTGKMLTAIGKAVDMWKSKSEGDSPKLQQAVATMSQKIDNLSSQLGRLLAKLDKLVPST